MVQNKPRWQDRRAGPKSRHGRLDGRSQGQWSWCYFEDVEFEFMPGVIRSDSQYSFENAQLEIELVRRNLVVVFRAGLLDLCLGLIELRLS